MLSSWGDSLKTEILSSPQSVAQRAAESFAESSSRAIEDHQIFTVALSGGNTPRLMHTILASDLRFRDRISWGQIHFFWGDERHVPPDHPDSNYRMAHETLLCRVPIPPGNIHRIQAELKDSVEAAALYDLELQKHAAKLGNETNPASLFDLILLGMGPDGHTASLFPGTEALNNHANLVVSNWVPKLNTHRITLTPPVLTEAQKVILLVTGAEKAAVVKEAFLGSFRISELPVQILATCTNPVDCFFDVAAASQLQPT